MSLLNITSWLRVAALLLMTLLATACNHIPKELRVEHQEIEPIAEQAIAAVEQKTGVSLDGLRWRLAGKWELAEALQEEMLPFFNDRFSNEQVAYVYAKYSSQAMADVLYGLYLPADDLILLNPAGMRQAFDWDKMPSREVLEKHYLALMLHETVHAAQHRLYDVRRLRRASGHIATARAYKALSEGHAEHVTHQLCQEMGCEEAHNNLLRQLTNPDLPDDPVESRAKRMRLASTVFAYVVGADFIGALDEQVGQDAIDEVFLNPPMNLWLIKHPDAYLVRRHQMAKLAPLDEAFMPMRDFYAGLNSVFWRGTSSPEGLEEKYSMLPRGEVEEVLSSQLQDMEMVVVSMTSLGDTKAYACITEMSTVQAAENKIALQREMFKRLDAGIIEGRLAELDSRYEELELADQTGFVRLAKVKDDGETSLTRFITLARGRYVLELQAHNTSGEAPEYAELAQEMLSKLAVPN